MIKLATTKTAAAKLNVNASVFMPRTKNINNNNDDDDNGACNIEALDECKPKQPKLMLPWKGFPKPIKYEQHSSKAPKCKEPMPNELKDLKDQKPIVKVGILEEKRLEQERQVAVEAIKLVEQRRIREALQQPKDMLHLTREPINFTAEERLRVNRLRIIKRQRIEQVLREMRQELETKKQQQQQLKQQQQQQQSKQQQQQQQSKLEEQQQQQHKQQLQQQEQQSKQHQQPSKLEEQQLKLEQIRIKPNSRYVCLQRASKPDIQMEHKKQSEQQQRQLEKPEQEQQSNQQQQQPEQQLASQQPQQLLDSKPDPKPAAPRRYIPTAKQWDERCRAKASEATAKAVNKENTVAGKSAGKLEECSQLPRAMSVSSQSNIMPMAARKMDKCGGGTGAKELFVPRYWPPAPLTVGQGERRRGNLIHARNISRAFANCGLLPTPNSNCNSSSSSNSSANSLSIYEELLPPSKSIKRYGIDELLKWEPKANKLEQPHIDEGHRKLAFIYK